MEHERVLREIIEWAKAEANVRAVVLTGSAAVGDEYLDPLSDLDVELYVAEPERLLTDRSWYNRFGDVLVVEELPNPGWHPTRLVYYVAGKVDFMIAPVDAVGRFGYEQPFRALVDKDGLGAELTRLPSSWSPPRSEQFEECVNWFYAAALMWAKCLVRNEPWLGKVRDWDAKQSLLKVIEWDHKARYGPDYETWFNGKRFRKWVDADVQAAVELCWTGIGGAENAAALRASVELFELLRRRTAEAFTLKTMSTDRVQQEVEALLTKHDFLPE